MKKVKIGFNQEGYSHAVNQANKPAGIFNTCKTLFEEMTGKSLEDIEAFQKDVYNYTMDKVKTKYKVQLSLGFDDDVVFTMLKINDKVDELKDLSNQFKSLGTSVKINKETGWANPYVDAELYTYYAETPEQLERLDFCNKIIEVCEKGSELDKRFSVRDGMEYFRKFLALDPFIISVYYPQINFVLTGN